MIKQIRIAKGEFAKQYQSPESPEKGNESQGQAFITYNYIITEDTGDSLYLIFYVQKVLFF